MKKVWPLAIITLAGGIKDGWSSNDFAQDGLRNDLITLLDVRRNPASVGTAWRGKELWQRGKDSNLQL